MSHTWAHALTSRVLPSRATQGAGFAEFERLLVLVGKHTCECSSTRHDTPRLRPAAVLAEDS